MAAAEDNLRLQFQLLQDQQQKKLLRRKQRKEEKERAHTASVISTSSSAFGVPDNLDLKVYNININIFQFQVKENHTEIEYIP